MLTNANCQNSKGHDMWLSDMADACLTLSNQLLSPGLGRSLLSGRMQCAQLHGPALQLASVAVYK